MWEGLAWDQKTSEELTLLVPVYLKTSPYLWSSCTRRFSGKKCTIFPQKNYFCFEEVKDKQNQETGGLLGDGNIKMRFKDKETSSDFTSGERETDTSRCPEPVPIFLLRKMTKDVYHVTWACAREWKDDLAMAAMSESSVGIILPGFPGCCATAQLWKKVTRHLWLAIVFEP